MDLQHDEDPDALVSMPSRCGPEGFASDIELDTVGELLLQACFYLNVILPTFRFFRRLADADPCTPAHALVTQRERIHCDTLLVELAELLYNTLQMSCQENLTKTA